ncbi:MAG: RtcB family protein [Leptospiraceae bacterium]|nr:RtcB family protein [Leptospiraceae bacterium]
MCISEVKGVNVPIKLWTRAEEVESEALQQLKNISALPWVFHHVAVMPDVHYGKGATVGSVIAMKDAISPAAVGVDIGCGMAALKTNLKAFDLPESLSQLRQRIEAKIPLGHEAHDSPVIDEVFKRDSKYKRIVKFFRAFKELDPKVQELQGKAMKQVGTLGSGNHFIELCLDSEKTVWLMLHSGSRNIGKSLAEIHIGRAKKLAHNQSLPDKDLAVFLENTEEMRAYRRDLEWAQDYALLNRKAMLFLYKKIMKSLFPQMEVEEEIHCHHNYVSEEIHFGENLLVTRKGAISARTGEMGIIPGSMGARSFIVRGLGNPDSFQSASHGAGRRMSRGEAKRRFSRADLERETLGVECRKDGGVIDEIPSAYKNIDEVMKNQSGLVEIVYELKQILCVKG